MKMIVAVIKTDKLDFVKKGLAEAGFPALTTYEVKGRGRQSGIVQTVNGYTLYADLLPKTKVEVVVQDERLQEAIDVIVENCRTGSIGDGKIFVSNVEQAVRIRTGDRGKEAV